MTSSAVQPEAAVAPEPVSATRDFNPRFFEPRRACPVCGFPDPTEIYRCGLSTAPVRDFIASHYAEQGTVDWSLLHGTDYVLCACPRCALIFQQHAPKPVVLQQIYEEMVRPENIERVERERLTLDNFDRIAGEMAVLFRLCGKHPSTIRFLDYGFGHGRWARVARAIGATVFATEIGEDKKAAASAIGVEIIADEDIDAMRFDIVHTEQVLEHLVDPAEVFHRLAWATDGIMKVAVPAHGDIRRLLRTKGMARRSPLQRIVQGGHLSRADNSYLAIAPLEHLNIYSRRTVETLAAASNMRIVSRVRRGAVAVDFTNWAGLARSAARASAMVVKSALVPDMGYYLLAPRDRSHLG